MPEISTLSFSSDPNLKAYWRFESGALTTDSSGNSHTLTDIGTPTLGTGKFGGSVSLDGSTDAYSMADHADFKPSGSFSISAWFKTSASSGNLSIIQSQRNPGAGQVRGFLCWISSAGSAYFRTGTGTAFNDLAAGTGYNDGNFHHVVFVFNGTTKYIYVDGALVNSVGWANTIAWDTVYQRIGCHTDNGSTNIEFFNGDLDDIAMFDRVLTATEIVQIYMNGKASGGNKIYSFDATGGTYGVHVFTSSGTFTPDATLSEVDVIVVAGGGGGGGANSAASAGAGGGGAGGVKQQDAVTVTPSTGVTVTIGGGGGGGAAGGSAGSKGSNSTFNAPGGAITSEGGGYGGGSSGANGGAGGSGGGASNGSTGFTGGAGTSGEGNNGGSTGAYQGPGAGGGGKDAVGETVGTGSGPGGAGGSGHDYSLTFGTGFGASGIVGGGGSGGSIGDTNTAGGSGGGGTGGGSVTNPTAGTANTGGGGGGSGNKNAAGAAGGSGVVVVRYLISAISTGASLLFYFM